MAIHNPGSPAQPLKQIAADHAELWQKFGHAIEGGDTAECVALLGELGPGIYDAVRDLDVTLPSIVSAFMPKSGGTFLHNRLLTLGYREFHWGFTGQSSHAHVYAVPECLKLYLRGGCASHTHALPRRHNVKVFAAGGAPRIWVHIRDPRETVIAAYHHYLGQGQGEGEIALERIRGNNEEAERLKLAIGTGAENELDDFVRKHLPFFAGWIREWLAFAEQNPDTVLFTDYHQLTQDASGLLGSVLEQFSGSKHEVIIPARLPHDRRRERSADHWSDGLGLDTVAYANALVDDQLGPFARWHATRAGDFTHMGVQPA